MPPSKPTILQIIPNLDTGGAERTTLEIVEAIIAAGGRALVLSEGGRLVDDIKRAGGDFIAFPASSKNPGRMLSNAARIAAMIRTEGVDLVHARSRAPAWSALLAARRTGIPFVTTYHGAYKEKSALKRLYNSVMARGDRVIANSRYTAQSIASRYGTPDSRLRIVYRGVDISRFDPDAIASERIAALRERWGISPARRIIAHVARLTPIKGHATVIDAAARLKADGLLGDTVFVFAGDAQGHTSYVEELNERVAQHGLQDHFRLVGHVDDVPAAFASAHCALLVSTEPEGFGRSSIEAQAMRCPVIVSRIGALEETLNPLPDVPMTEATGAIVEPGDAAQLASALARLLSLTTDEHAAMGARARAFVEARYTTTALQRATLAVYDELIEGAHLSRSFCAATG